MVQEYSSMATTLTSREMKTVTVADRTMEKPLLDNRDYKVIMLPNKLEALIIHDPDTDKASAAMDIDVGSLMDDEDLPGMAHAVEHLLFLGTEKYPGDNDYNAYLTKYGGSSNAFTASTSTNYFFELSASSVSNSARSSAATSKASLTLAKEDSPLYGGLDRFAQFFIKPLFLEDALDRELQAVDSENKKNLQSDTWRLHQLNKSTSSTKHPFHKFSTGNYKVLHDDPIARGVKIRDAFISFYQKHYSANRMKLVVLGRESLDVLQMWVEELFSAVPNQDLEKNRWDGIPAYDTDELCTQTFVKPVMDMRELELTFPYPDEDELYASQPSRYISHLIGHEGPGSLYEYIRGKGWATGLSAGSRPTCPGTSFFSVTIRLTEDGLKNYEDIVKHVFQYIAMLKENPPYEWIVDEMAKLSEVEFKYMQKIPASRTTSRLGGLMQRSYPRDMLLSGQQLIREFNPEGIKEGLAALRPDNFRMTLISKDFPGDWPLREKWYNTEYKYEKIPKDFLQQVEATATEPKSSRPEELHLPGKNEFVPQRLDVEKKEVENPLTAPKLIRNDENVRAWFKKDDRFWVPKANIYITLRTPLVYATPLTTVMASLFVELVNDSLSDYAYDAELAGLDYSVNVHGAGIDVNVQGYNDKMSVLLEKVLLSMRDLKIKDDRFEIIKERKLRGYKNFEYQEPYRQITIYSRWLSTERSWVMYQLREVLPAITAADVRSFFPQMLRQMHIEMLVHGNLYKEDALNTASLVERTLKPKALPTSQWPTRRFVDIPVGSAFRYERVLANAENVNHCIDYNVRVSSRIARHERAKLLLVGQIADEPCFDMLRTKEQLGYVVSGGVVSFGLNSLAGYRVLIQSERDCAYLETRIEAFFNQLATILKEMPDSEFEAHKIGLINKKLQKLKNLNEETSRFWLHIADEGVDFEQHELDVEEIEPLTKESIIEFYNTHFLPDSLSFTRSAVWLVAQGNSGDTAANVDSIKQNEKLTDTAHTSGDVQDGEMDKKRKTVVVEDVRAFKASMPLTAGPIPVKHLSEFEELEPKL